MKILLLQDVKTVGKKGEIKEVADGFALNAILPKKLALVATPEVLKKYELEQKQKHAEEKIQRDLAEKTFADLKEKKVVMKANASDKGHLFASIHIGEILAALKDQLHITLNQSWVELKQPIKEVGEYKLKLKAHGIDGVLTVEIAK
jgi:large subunit ribosomal protein L9